MDEISSSDVLGFAIKGASAINGLWNVFIAVTTATFGILSADKSLAGSPALKLCLTLAFLFFAAVNFQAIIRLAGLRRALLTMLPPSLSSNLRRSLMPAATWMYGLFHAALDLIVVSAIWTVPWQSLAG